MAKKQTAFICQQCSYQVSKWMGKCPECGEWNSFLEEFQFGGGTAGSQKKVAPLSLGSSAGEFPSPRPISEVELEEIDRFSTKINEFDRVLGGGIVPGSITLVGGEPGIGKSTLLLQISCMLANTFGKVLYVSGEESESQVASRARRLGLSKDRFYILHETNWNNIYGHISKLRPQFFILDSIQTTVSPEIASPPGTISQIREVTYELMNYAKTNNLTSFVIGHVTKEGTIAGPKVLEHMVDTVVYFEGDQNGHYRLLRAIKNRFGNTNEVGIFQMEERGLVEVPNPSQFFLESSLEDAYGRSISCIVEGSRTLFVEIQALAVENKYGNGRRTTQGLDTNRLAMLVAIIEKYFGIFLGFHDIYLNVVGGMRLLSRETDLCIIASILSSLRKKAISSTTVFLGEVGLTGEVRSVPMVEMRLKEMSQFNYKRVITSEKIAKQYRGRFPIEIIGVKRAVDLEGILFKE